MSSTSQKHKDFVAEPMGEKTVMVLAGIGEVLGRRLEEKGFDKDNLFSYCKSPAHPVSTYQSFVHAIITAIEAYVVLGQFLVLKKDEELFRDWLKDTCSANSKQQKDCFSCLKEWCDAFL